MSPERMVARQKASDVGLDVYEAAESSPISAAYNFASRIQRQPISTTAEVAEGHESRRREEDLRHLFMGKGS